MRSTIMRHPCCMLPSEPDLHAPRLLCFVLHVVSMRAGSSSCFSVVLARCSALSCYTASFLPDIACSCTGSSQKPGIPRHQGCHAERPSGGMSTSAPPKHYSTQRLCKLPH